MIKHLSNIFLKLKNGSDNKVSSGKESEDKEPPTPPNLPEPFEIDSIPLSNDYVNKKRVITKKNKNIKK